jgi:hypothetical protein
VSLANDGWISWNFDNSQKSIIKTYPSSAIEYDVTEIVDFPRLARTIRLRLNGAPITDIETSPVVVDILRAMSAMLPDIRILIGFLRTKLIGICIYATSGLK